MKIHFAAGGMIPPGLGANAATATKDEAFQALTDDMKGDLRYAENTVNYKDDKPLLPKERMAQIKEGILAK